MSKTELSLNKSDVFAELIRLQRSEDGNTLQQSEQYIRASHWHAFYLFSGQGIPRMLQGEILVFYFTFVSLRGHIFASIEICVVHMYEMWQMNRLWLTQIYLYR